ncbi:histone deacetylase [Streptomyces sp. NPDC049906]|uniref:histone deacetylase n=1 Tax=Streptomyces sp. NPDC049906 TaxID=3155656 RepID=UPI003435620E
MSPARTLSPSRPAGPVERVWYASYGSNTDTERLRHYLVGGRPPGAARSCPGCRDPRPPERSVPVLLPGGLYFATESPLWTGGSAFYDPDAGGELWARAHLLGVQQFSDIAAQEMHRPPGTDLDLSTVLRDGRHPLGPGRYETLLCPGSLEGLPVLTFTASWHSGDVEVTAPTAGYLRHLARGLLATGVWDVPAVARYLSRAPGAAGRWTPREVAALLAEPP